MSLKSGYVIREKIGSGSMATVSKALQKSLERLVAVKQIHPHLADHPEFVSRFEREAKAAAHLKHVNIMDIIDFGKDVDGSYFIVVEYIAGPTLLNVMKSGKLPLPVVLSAMVQVLAALEHAHNNGVVHRDVKPENIMLTAAGVVKLTDFGIAQAAKLPSLTHGGQRIGTPSYMSPEQAEGKRVDHRSDLFSVGIILYEMLTQRLPFQGSSVSTLNKVVHEPPPPIHSVDPSVPSELVSIVERALEKDPTKRFFDAAEFSYELEEYAVSASMRLHQRVLSQHLETTMDQSQAALSEEDLTPSQIKAMRHTTSAGKVRPTVAILPLQGCMGCHVNLLDLHERFFDLNKMVDIRFTHLMDVKEIPEVDVGLVEGCVDNTENERLLLALRNKCKVLVALGTCACYGGIPGLRNLHPRETVVARSYSQSESLAPGPQPLDPQQVPALTEHVRTVSDLVRVDASIPGCPPPHGLLLESISNLVSGTTVKAPTHNLCYECHRRHREMLNPQRKFIADEVRSIMEVETIDPSLCFLEQGVLCLGLTTREGCGARCLSHNVPCQGCMGPAPNVRETGAKWVNAVGSLLPCGAVRFRHDIVGLGYRFALPISMMPFSKDGEV